MTSEAKAFLQRAKRWLLSETMYLKVGTVGMGLVFASILFFFRYELDPSRSYPNQTMGITYRLQQGSHFFYVTLSEFIIFYFLMGTGYSLLFFSGIYGNIRLWKNRRMLSKGDKDNIT
ncbi:hypothetical protein LLG95_09630 [bacterium]|nr:hypothetical protein [bacterium]